MVALPETITKTVAAVDAALEAEQRSRHGYRIAASKIGSECERALYYDFRWVTAPERHKGQTLRIFASGNIYEDRVIGWLRASGQELTTHEGFKDDGTATSVSGYALRDVQGEPIRAKPLPGSRVAIGAPVMADSRARMASAFARARAA